MSRQDPQRIARARRLYSSGLSPREVAPLVGVHQSTIWRWIRTRAPDGLPWAQARRRWQRARRDTVLATFREHIGRLVLQLVADQDARGLDKVSTADLHSVVAALKALSHSADHEGRVLSALSEFAEWCAEHLEPEQIEAVRGPVEAFMAAVSREEG